MKDKDEGDRIEARLALLEAAVLLDHAHVENLIERVYELENTVAAVVARLAAVERATPLKGPPKRPMR